MAEINDYLDGLNYILNTEEKQFMDIFAECWEHCTNISCDNCEYRPSDERFKILICISYQYAKRLIAADVEPVRHGHWIECNYGLTFECSECKYPTEYNLTDYCPSCGAKMDGDKNG